MGIKTIVVVTIAGVAALALSDDGRRSASDDTAGDEPVVEVAPATATIVVGDSLQLTAALLDDERKEIPGQSFTWWSANHRIALVRETGVVVAVRTGSVTIAAVTEDRTYSGFSDVEVVAQARQDAPAAAADQQNMDEDEDHDPAAPEAEIEPELPAVSSSAGPEQAAMGDGGPGPNEPDGFVEQARRPFDAYNENGWRDRHHGGNQAISDGTMRMTYRSGFVGGSAPGSSGVYFGKDIGGYRSVYLAHDLLLSPNFQGHGSAQNKVWYFNDANGKASILTVKAYGGTGATEFTIVPTAGQTKNSVNGRARGSNMYPNRGGPKIRRGQRVFVEMIVTMNSSPSSYDGELHIWIDGARTHEFSPARGNGINWYDAGEGSRVGQVKWTPVWGGVGNKVQSTMYMEMGGIYISAQ